MTATTERQTPVVPARLSRPINWLMEEVPARRLEVVRVITVLYCVAWIAIRTDHWRHLASCRRAGGDRSGSPAGSAVGHRQRQSR